MAKSLFAIHFKSNSVERDIISNVTLILLIPFSIDFRLNAEAEIRLYIHEIYKRKQKQ